MTFSVEFIKDDVRFPKLPKKIIMGKITIGEYYETFEASLSYWKKKDYYMQWYDGAKRITLGEEKSCIITAMYNPKWANFIIMWPIYNIGDDAVFQNNYLLLDELDGRFDPLNPYKYINNKRSKTETGHTIEEWRISIDELRKYCIKIENSGFLL